MVGLFINTLPARVQVREEGLLLPWLMELQAQHVEREQYSYSSLAEVQRWSDIPPGASLFESIVVFENYPLADSLSQQTGGLEVNLVRAMERTNYPIALSVSQGSKLKLQIQYDGSRFDPAAISRVISHLRTLLQEFAVDPCRRILEISMLTKPERGQLLVEWNQTGVEYPSDKCVHQMFEAQAQKRPDAIAVISNDHQLTYNELNRRANQVARYLVKRGVGPGAVVAIADDRTQQAIVGILGILKAGGAYSPLDTQSPTDRILGMINDSKASFILIDEDCLREMIPAWLDSVRDYDEASLTEGKRPRSRVLYVEAARVVSPEGTEDGAARNGHSGPGVLRWDRISVGVESEAGSNSVCLSSADDPAYVMYTSGSTGEPKGVEVTNRGILRLLFGVEYVDLGADRSILQMAPVSFDASTFEIWGPLLHGGRCVLYPDAVPTVGKLGEVIESQDITTLWLTGSLFNTVIDEAPEILRDIEQLLIGGEALSVEHVRRAYEALPLTRIVNGYGPTEGTTFTCCHKIPRVLSGSARSIPIGRPISNTAVYILDRYMEPVPVGVSGELYIGGAGLSSGYVGDAGLTVEKYVPNPFSGIEGDRMYRTGDLCRYLSDGSIEFIGRVDHQVKLRGFRIELGEIESVLVGHELVRESVVLYREDEPGEKRLVAYVVLERGSELGVTELRGYLREKLPEYMIPSRYVMLESLPLTSSGKVDRLSLPTPEGLGRELESSYVAPRTEVEEKLAGIWSQVLGVERVGIHDNFFELGGDSILAIQIIARANEGGMRFTPKQLFEKQTIAELSGEVDSVSAVECDQGIVEGEVPLTPIQRWFFERGLSRAEHFNQAFMLEVGKEVEADLLELAIEGLVLHHDALRLRFEREGSVWRQFNAGPEAVEPLSRMDLSGISESEQEGLIESGASELQAGLDLRDGPILGAILFDLGEERGRRLLLVIHHLAVDVVSWRILLEDLWTGYEQLSRGESVRLPAKTTSFKRWSERLMVYGESEEVRGELEYWLSDSRSTVESLPVDHELVEGANTVGSTGTVTVSLSVEETRDLLQEVPKAYRTQITEVLLTALSMSFAGWTGSQLLLVDVEGHGREELFEEVDVSRTVGWFTSMYPLLLDLGEAQAPGEAIKRIKEQVRGVPNHGIGYGVLRYLSGDADISGRLRALPKAEVSFNYLGQLDQTLRKSSFLELSEDPGVPPCSPSACREHLLEVVAFVGDSRLKLIWTYTESAHLKRTVKRLANGYLNALKSLISHCLSPEARGHTPSDFPLAKLDQDKLHKLDTLLDRADRSRKSRNRNQDEER